ncbi:uncharacterized protein LOC135148249 isoform X2 [Daucus carota subsp. sativus]|uniref:uncharacterized protein LOC135148249 isoform X2 n=1 Tax=Daucus carota subsp. sativus TaxID=79200 RepID=UPI003083B00F
MDKPKHQWSRSGFRTITSSDMFVNNHSEVFNNSIRQFRDLPIITMFREIHKAVMKRIQMRRDKMMNMDITICPTAQKKLNKAIHFAGSCVVTWSGGTSYSVITSDGGHELVVDLGKKSCSCRKWDLTGIPCYHAAACIAMKSEPWDLHISKWFKKDMYIKLYSYTLEPMVGPEFWDDAPEPMPLPPNVKVPTGRPKKRRSRKNDIPTDPTKLRRGGGTVRCSHCKATSHNARTCQAKKSDAMAKAVAEGRDPSSAGAKKPIQCKKCKGTGHNSRTCLVKQNDGTNDASNATSNATTVGTNNTSGSSNVPRPPRFKRWAKKAAPKDSTVGASTAGASTARPSTTQPNMQWKGKPVTTIRQLLAAKKCSKDK